MEEIRRDIEKLRGKLNKLMTDDNSNHKKQIIETSVELDKMIIAWYEKEKSDR